MGPEPDQGCRCGRRARAHRIADRRGPRTESYRDGTRRARQAERACGGEGRDCVACGGDCRGGEEDPSGIVGGEREGSQDIAVDSDVLSDGGGAAGDGAGRGGVEAVHDADGRLRDDGQGESERGP